MTSARISFAGFNLGSVTAVPQIIKYNEFKRVCIRGEEVITSFRGTNTVRGMLNAVGIAPVAARTHFTRVELVRPNAGCYGEGHALRGRKCHDEALQRR